MNLGKGFNLLMVFNAALTAGAVVLLSFWPEALPTSVGFPLARDAYPMGYMLAAAEVGLTIMFLFGRKIRDRQALRIVLASGAGFHIASAIAQLYAVTQGQAGNAVGANILLRCVMAALLTYYAIRRVGSAESVQA